jgi:hypothetical protein
MYGVDIINLAIQMLIEGAESISKIALKLKVTRKTIGIWKNEFQQQIQRRVGLTLDAYRKYRQQKERKTKSKTFSEQIVNFVINNAGCSLNDIWLAVDKNLSKSAICRVIKANGLSHRRISNRVVSPQARKMLNK